MKEDTVIEVKNLSKKFTRNLKRSMFYGTIDVARRMLGINFDSSKLRKGEFWSLYDINFDVKKGEALGVIGINGSGKTTLLRLINGIFPPDGGMISVKGRIGALIAVGAGFHPNLTGRENIFLNGSILGMRKEEIEEKFNDIVNFADIGEFIDAPVSTYSSGMYVRLGFAIAIHSKPDILLADEILAVGDLAFALKCYRKIAEFKENGGTILLVSHGIQLIRNTCSKVLWIDKGTVRGYGDTQAICDEYEQFILEKDAKADIGVMGTVLHNDPDVKIESVKFLDSEDKEVEDFKIGDSLKVRVSFNTSRVVNKPIFTVSFSNPENIQVISNYSSYDGFVIDKIEGKGHVDFLIEKITLKPSQYKCTITLTENNDINNHLEWHDKAYTFKILPEGGVSYGLINPFPTWTLTN
jgi:lipopolysaccharide transport system ATP-binding protein